MKKLLKNIRAFFNNIGGFFGGWWVLNVSQRDTIYSFYGFNHFEFAKKYADKRHKRNGLKNWVVPAGIGAEHLIVFNTREKKDLQRKGLMNRGITINDMLNAAYYSAEAKKK